MRGKNSNHTPVLLTMANQCYSRHVVDNIYLLIRKNDVILAKLNGEGSFEEKDQICIHRTTYSNFIDSIDLSLPYLHDNTKTQFEKIEGNGSWTCYCYRNTVTYEDFKTRAKISFTSTQVVAKLFVYLRNAILFQFDGSQENEFLINRLAQHFRDNFSAEETENFFLNIVDRLSELNQILSDLDISSHENRHYIITNADFFHHYIFLYRKSCILNA